MHILGKEGALPSQIHPRGSKNNLDDICHLDTIWAEALTTWSLRSCAFGEIRTERVL